MKKSQAANIWRRREKRLLNCRDEKPFLGVIESCPSLSGEKEMEKRGHRIPPKTTKGRQDCYLGKVNWKERRTIV